jgi:hypothetical protein
MSDTINTVYKETQAFKHCAMRIESINFNQCILVELHLHKTAPT